MGEKECGESRMGRRGDDQRMREKFTDIRISVILLHFTPFTDAVSPLTASLFGSLHSSPPLNISKVLVPKIRIMHSSSSFSNSCLAEQQYTSNKICRKLFRQGNNPLLILYRHSLLSPFFTPPQDLFVI